MGCYKIFAVLVIACLFIFSTTLGIAKGVPPGQAKKQGMSTQSAAASSTPPGWQRGKKTGWHGGKNPPGWSKWDKGKQTKWMDDRDQALHEISNVSAQYRISSSKRNEIDSAFNEAIAGGLLIKDAKDKLVGALKDETSRKALMIDTAQSVLELLK
ncbi:MAG: hypothetical protein V2A66_06610 [Pseudomonadota bacterium]